MEKGTIEQIYSEICQGYSENKSFRARHLSFVEESKLKKHYFVSLDKYLSLGCKSEDSILDDLIRQNKWSLSKESHMKILRNQLEGLERSKSKIKSFDQIDPLYDNIEEIKKDIREISMERYSLLSESAEVKAESRLRFYTMAASILTFENGGYKEIKEDFLDSLSDREFLEIESFYLIKMHNLTYENIKKICIDPFFYSSFTISDKPFDFFRKPLVELTTFQVTLLRIGETFSKVANEVPDLPKEYEGNPDKMLMFWYAVRNGAKEIEQKQKTQVLDVKNLFNQLRKSGR